ncbi:hypothetical protein [Pseudodesulfovibrio sediminis]|uniref:Uncharacterized protein n=1 Tax=Pseudodesulfovibrio sediminis TaxID=2810563 RepID=A0ABN6EP57_9BACT|nr:hypothetical protein [Pseudodesulfovibrio sediminis]BCS88182.1 hypothetical protein PSDVSF_14240 [Pseudodesulfovibrio sediminis]
MADSERKKSVYKLDFTHDSTIVVSALVLLFVGVLLLLLGHCYFKGTVSVILSGFASILIFSSAYGFVNELFLKKQFMQTLESAIFKIFRIKEKHDSIVHAGLAEIISYWSQNAIVDRMEIAKKCTILCIHNHDFFKVNYEKIIKMINANMSLDLIVINPDSKFVDACGEKFEGYDREQVAQRITTCIDGILCEKIYLGIEEESRERFKVYTLNHGLGYSAYLFDDTELWVCPFGCSKSKTTPPVYVYRKAVGGDHFYFDDMDCLYDSVEPVDFKKIMAARNR